MTLRDDRKSVNVEFVVADPEFLAEPLRGQVMWHYAPHLECITIECEPEIAQQYLESIDSQRQEPRVEPRPSGRVELSLHPD